MMEDGKEEEYDDNYVPPEYGDAATGEAEDAATREAVEDQEEPDDVPDDDDLRESFSMQGRNALVKRIS